MRWLRRSVLFARSLVLIVASRVLLDRLGTTATLRGLSSSVGSARRIDPLEALAAVRRAGHVFNALCLPQAVGLAALLQRGGHEPVLVLGCRREATGRWTAHAWVEINALKLEPVIALEHEPLAHLRETDGWVPSTIETSELND